MGLSRNTRMNVPLASVPATSTYSAPKPSHACQTYSIRPRYRPMRRAVKTPVISAAVAAASVAIERHFAAPHYHGPVSDHFDGKRFRNREVERQREGLFFKWQLNRDQGFWPAWI